MHCAYVRANAHSDPHIHQRLNAACAARRHHARAGSVASNTPVNATANASHCKAPSRSPNANTPVNAAPTGKKTVNTPACAAATVRKPRIHSHTDPILAARV